MIHGKFVLYSFVQFYNFTVQFWSVSCEGEEYPPCHLSLCGSTLLRMTADELGVRRLRLMPCQYGTIEDTCRRAGTSRSHFAVVTSPLNRFLCCLILYHLLSKIVPGDGFTKQEKKAWSAEVHLRSQKPQLSH
jgi:hypothetical protein